MGLRKEKKPIGEDMVANPSIVFTKTTIFFHVF